MATKYMNICTKFYKKFAYLYKSYRGQDLTEFINLLMTFKKTEYFSSKIARMGKGFKTCNNAFVKWFFGHQEIQSLYRVHDQYAKSSGSYDKVLGITEGISLDSRMKLYQLIEEIPNK